MSYLVSIVTICLLIAAVIAGLAGWLFYHRKCNKVIAEFESREKGLNAAIATYKNNLAEKQQQWLESHNQAVQLRSQLALAEGNADLMRSRWQSTLKQARQARSYLKWIQALQRKLAAKNIHYQQNRQYAERMALEAKNNKQNLMRAHHRLTEIEHKQQSLRTWIGVFQAKLMKTKTEYAQLRNYAQNTQSLLNATQENLSRTHARLTEIEHKQQPLRTWSGVFQAKLMKTKTEYAQLRSYAQNTQSLLNATQENLSRTHARLTAVGKELTNLQDAGKNPAAIMPPRAAVNDSKTLRLVDRIRLLGTSKDAVYGRMHNQIREARLETIETERVLTDSCEEKDAIIADLRAQLHKAENRAQKAPVIHLDQSVKIKQLESTLAQVKADAQANSELENQLREHAFTIEAYRAKLKDTQSQLHERTLTIEAYRCRPNPAKEQLPAKADFLAQERDDLKLIKGIGPRLESMLNDLGIYQFSQIAAWKKADIEKISAKLAHFKNRIKRDEWVKKARDLNKNQS